MKVTNRLNLPAAFVKAVSVERHNRPHCYSATTLLKGAKEVLLQERHWDELEQDAADGVWAVFGSAAHGIFERAEDDNFHEERFAVPVLNSTVTGVVDSYDMANGVIYDWKTASVWKVQFADFADWRRQGLVYAWLLTQQGLRVDRCRFIALLKDHSKSKARHDREYPQSPVFAYEFDVTPADLEDTEAWVSARVAALEAAEKMADDDIEPCTAEERWCDGDKWAVMKSGRKSAVRVLDSEADAEALRETLGGGHYVERRPAVSRKCADYCLCRDFCSFYKAEAAHDGHQ